MEYNGQNRLMNEISPETCIHGTDRQISEGKGLRGWEEFNPRTYMYICIDQGHIAWEGLG